MKQMDCPVMAVLLVRHHQPSHLGVEGGAAAAVRMLLQRMTLVFMIKDDNSVDYDGLMDDTSV